MYRDLGGRLIAQISRNEGPTNIGATGAPGSRVHVFAVTL